MDRGEERGGGFKVVSLMRVAGAGLKFANRTGELQFSPGSQGPSQKSFPSSPGGGQRGNLLPETLLLSHKSLSISGLSFINICKGCLQSVSHDFAHGATLGRGPFQKLLLVCMGHL